jgi:hypothetical protein
MPLTEISVPTNAGGTRRRLGLTVALVSQFSADLVVAIAILAHASQALRAYPDVFGASLAITEAVLALIPIVLLGFTVPLVLSVRQGRMPRWSTPFETIHTVVFLVGFITSSGQDALSLIARAGMGAACLASAVALVLVIVQARRRRIP